MEIRMTTGKEKCVIAAQSYLAAFALSNIGQLSTTSIITLVLFFVCFQFFLFATVREKEALIQKDGKRLVRSLPAQKRFRSAFLLGLLFTCFYLAAEHQNLTGSLENPLFRAFYLLMTAAGLLVLFFHCLKYPLLVLEGRSQRILALKKPSPEGSRLPLQVKILIPGILLCCWLPWFLYNFPGVMTPDSLSQYRQAMGLTGYSDHHPFLHTLILQLFLRAGMAVFDNVYAAIACYTVFQMVAMALIILYCICVLYRYNAGKKLCFFFLLFYALVPYNGIYSVTLWKDILFSGVMLIFALSLYQLLHLENEGEHLTRAALAERLPLFVKLCLFGLLLTLMRSNGLYVFLLTVPFLLFSLRKEYRLLLPALAIVLGLSLLIKGPLYHALGVEKPAFSESISIPAQQIARVVYEGRKLSEEQIQLLEQTVDYDSIASYYQPELSDPIKALIQYGNPEYLETHKLEYLKLWLSLGISYPLDYWNAFVDQTKGYWFPAAPGLLTNEGISPNEEGLSWQPILRGAIVWKTVEILGKLYTIFPLYGLLYSPGAFTWAALFLFVNCLRNGRRKNLTLFVPFFALVLTLCLATPVASDMRYIYPLVFSMPLLIYASLEMPDTMPREKNSPHTVH